MSDEAVGPFCNVEMCLDIRVHQSVQSELDLLLERPAVVVDTILGRLEATDCVKQVLFLNEVDLRVAGFGPAKDIEVIFCTCSDVRLRMGCTDGFENQKLRIVVYTCATVSIYLVWVQMSSFEDTLSVVHVGN